MKSYIARLFPLTALFAVLLVAVPAAAETAVRTGEEVSIAHEQTVLEDLYVAGNKTTVSGTVAGDIYALANSFTYNGSSSADLVVAAARASIAGMVADDVRVVAGDVEIDGEIGGDVFVLGGTLSILSTAHITGDLFFFGGRASIEGAVDGSVMGSYSSLRLNAPVGGDVDITVGDTFTLGDRAVIVGNVSYESARDAVRSPEAVVEGQMTKNAAPQDDEPAPTYRPLIISILILLFGSLCIYLFTRARLGRFITQDCLPLGLRGLVGLGAILALPLVGLLLLVTVLGIWLGLLVLALWIILLVVSYLLIPIFLGAWLSYALTKKYHINTLSIAAGAALFAVLLLIPIVGTLVLFFAGCVIAGGIVHALLRLSRR